VPCPHKFRRDLTLDNLDFAPSTLIIGTFNPAWESLCNTATWFYGRTHNNYFWEVLPRLFGEASLRQATSKDWKAFCRNHRIALTDLIENLDDADPNNPHHVEILKCYRDDQIVRHFRQIHWVDISRILTNNPGIRQVYFTRSSQDAWRKRWEMIEDDCRTRSIHAQTLLTPSGSARFQMPKNYTQSLGDFILAQWRGRWHAL
jgi:hypothetical protein